MWTGNGGQSTRRQATVTRNKICADFQEACEKGDVQRAKAVLQRGELAYPDLPRDLAKITINYVGDQGNGSSNFSNAFSAAREMRRDGRKVDWELVDWELVDFLLDHPLFDVNIREEDGTPLHIVAESEGNSRDVHMARKILANPRFTVKTLNAKNQYGATPLMVACRSGSGSVEMVKELVDVKGIDLTLDDNIFKPSVEDIVSKFATDMSFFKLFFPEAKNDVDESTLLELDDKKRKQKMELKQKIEIIEGAANKKEIQEKCNVSEKKDDSKGARPKEPKASEVQEARKKKEKEMKKENVCEKKDHFTEVAFSKVFSEVTEIMEGAKNKKEMQEKYDVSEKKDDSKGARPKEPKASKIQKAKKKKEKEIKEKYHYFSEVTDGQLKKAATGKPPVEKDEEGQPPVPRAGTVACQSCGKFGPDTKCRGCGKVVYCSERCQAKDWRNHKKACDIAREKRERRQRKKFVEEVE